MNRTPTKHAAFTLTELMVSILIITILASVTLYAMASVQTQAQVQRTKAQLARIHDIMLEKLESYDGFSPQRTVSGGLNQEQTRVCAVRETMRIEMPDRITDVLRFNSGGTIPTQGGRAQPLVPTNLQSPPFLNRYYVNFVNSRVNWSDKGWSFEHQGAECLYMILSRIEVGQRTALEFFSETEIGDKDRDGMPEILDAWGNPVRFVRWPVGLLIGTTFVDVNELDPLDPGRAFEGVPQAGGPKLISGLVQHGMSHLTVPLVVSSGPDMTFDLTLANESGPLFYGATGPSIIPNDPWRALGGGKLMCSVSDDNNNSVNDAIDNIYSHIIETSIR